MNLFNYTPTTPLDLEIILKEMIQKVDKTRLGKLIKIAASDKNDMRTPGKVYIATALQKWAMAKYPYYMLFGHELTSSVLTDEILSQEDFKKRVMEFTARYPQYEAFILCQNPIAVAKNWEPKKYPNVPEFSRMSQYFAWQFRDQKFDNDYAAFLEQKKAQEYIRISIDPCDFLTMSINRHGWHSCHNIENGCFATGGFSYMTDEATMIAYRDDGREYDYEILGVSFKGNSKKWRQCVYMDPRTCSVLLSRQYPQDDFQSESILCVKKILSRQLKALNPDYAGAPVDMEEFTVDTDIEDYGKANIRYEPHHGNFNYHDLGFGYSGEYLGEKNAWFCVGSQVCCPVCGMPLNANHTNSPVVCGTCA